MHQGLMIIVLAVLVGFGLLMVTSYNRLVDLRFQLERAWANIDVILKQRFDELPQLMKVVEQYTGYEAGILKELAAARASYGAAHSVDDKIRAAGELSAATRGVFALGEAYPELRSNQNFLQLQSRVSDLENAIADRRESYNECVANFNARIQQLPDVLAANLLGYRAQNPYRVTEAERGAVDLTMDLPRFAPKA